MMMEHPHIPSLLSSIITITIEIVLLIDVVDHRGGYVATDSLNNVVQVLEPSVEVTLVYNQRKFFLLRSLHWTEGLDAFPYSLHFFIAFKPTLMKQELIKIDRNK